MSDSNEKKILTISDVEEQIREKLGDPSGSFYSMWSFDSGENFYCLPFSYRKKNSKGEWMKKEFTMPVQMTYDPFTGEKLKK